MLYIVSTPIGNLKDITLRAIEILKTVDIIAAEDTRRTRILLRHYEIDKEMISYNDHNKTKRIPKLIAILKEQGSVALVSDSGTPGISDPGHNLVREAIRNQIAVVPVPGPNAAISALVSSGLPTDSFAFYGFLPKKEKKRLDFLDHIKEKTETIIVYESPHRIKKTLASMEKMIPNNRICLARELTKVHEEFIRGTPRKLNDTLRDRNLKGEIVLLISSKKSKGIKLKD